MVKPIKLSKKNGIAIVSLSAGTIGEEFASHQLDLAIKRLNLDFQLNVMIAKNALKGIKVLKENPMLKVEDLNEVFSNVNVKAIICAIGGFDTYKTIPLLLEDENFKNLVLNNPKIFIGYSDSTVNHLMFYRLGLKTFYAILLNLTKKCCLILKTHLNDYLIIKLNLKLSQVHIDMKNEMIFQKKHWIYQERNIETLQNMNF
ncbi:LD-carboxypeptidase [Metamycoplasma hominis]|uniref:LD-carboxypeptidase n=1 Tax=Metamycoplasma hominis TaxID=2098 RepID=UPI003CEBFF1B